MMNPFANDLPKRIAQLMRDRKVESDIFKVAEDAFAAVLDAEGIILSAEGRRQLLKDVLIDLFQSMSDRLKAG